MELVEKIPLPGKDFQKGMPPCSVPLSGRSANKTGSQSVSAWELQDIERQTGGQRERQGNRRSIRRRTEQTGKNVEGVGENHDTYHDEQQTGADFKQTDMFFVAIEKQQKSGE